MSRAALSPLLVPLSSPLPSPLASLLAPLSSPVPVAPTTSIHHAPHTTHPPVLSQFKADIDNMIADAEARWTEYYGDLHAGPFNVGCMADCFKTTCSCMKDCGYCGSSSA